MKNITIVFLFLVLTTACQEDPLNLNKESKEPQSEFVEVFRFCDPCYTSIKSDSVSRSGTEWTRKPSRIYFATDPEYVKILMESEYNELADTTYPVEVWVRINYDTVFHELAHKVEWEY